MAFGFGGVGKVGGFRQSSFCPFPSCRRLGISAWLAVSGRQDGSRVFLVGVALVNVASF